MMANPGILKAVTDAVNSRDKAVPSEVNYYDGIISAYEREFKKWETRAEKVVKRYRDEQRAKVDNDHTKFNILWSNVQTLVPAVFSRIPQPDVSRRFRDNDPVGRVASLVLERSLEYEIGHYADYKNTMRQVVLDRFLPGRGTAWARYEPHFRAAAAQLPADGLEVTEDIDEQEAPEEVDYECAPVDYVHWKDFGHNVARSWEEVFVVWRAVYMTRAGCVERFGKEKGNKIPLDTKPDDKKSNWTEDDRQYRALIYEIWDKEEKKAFWLSKSMKQMLDEREDPLGLQDFFPCPKPLYATTTNETLIPVPDFTLYQDQAIELDTLADRIDGLIKMLQVKGTYDGAIPELARLFTEGTNGTLIAVKNYAAYAEKKGLAGGTDIFDLKPIYEALRVAFESMTQLKEHVYEITGISDIVRGQTSASETLGAQQIKENFVGLRLRDMQQNVAQFAAEALQLKAQIMCGKFSPKTLATISAADQLSPEDQQFLPQAMALLVGEARLSDPEAESGPNPMRAFRIEINADTLVQMDEKAEQTAVQELLVGMGTFLQQAGQVAAAAPQLVPFFLELLKWALSKYKAGKTLEGTLDMALDQMKQQAAAPKPPPPPDPKVEAEKQKLALDQERMQSELAMKKEEHVQTMAMEREKHRLTMQHDNEKQQLGMQHDMQKHEMNVKADTERHQMSVEGQKHIESQKAVAARPQAVLDEQQISQLAGPLAELVQAVGKTMDGQSQQVLQAIAALQQASQMLVQAATAPREHVVAARDSNGKISKTVSRMMQ